MEVEAVDGSVGLIQQRMVVEVDHVPPAAGSTLLFPRFQPTPLSNHVLPAAGGAHCPVASFTGRQWIPLTMNSVTALMTSHRLLAPTVYWVSFFSSRHA
jgi:hypothetical protein